MVQKLSYKFQELESDILEERSHENKKIYQLKKELLYMVHSIAPLRDSFELLLERNGRREDEYMDYYKDIFGRLEQLTKLIQSYKEMVDGIYEIQMSNIFNEMNRTMMVKLYFLLFLFPGLFWPGPLA